MTRFVHATSRPFGGSGTSSWNATVRGSLLWRLLGAQLLVIAIAVAASGFAISQQAAHAFMAVMMRYHVDPATIEAEFQTASRRIFVVSSLVAATIAMLLGWALMTRIVRPLKQMMMLSERIARGDYARHVDIRGRDGIGPLDLPMLVARLVEVYRPEFVRRGLHLTAASDDRLPSVEADGDLVDRALRNLIDNALRYAPAGAQVTVGARRDGGDVRLAVS